ncbi:MAG: exonuclease domain-containing protein [Lachnospiraceae bacterium]|nr:exonuclease domain-containing protein [Lachnospiraceae bacterium]
MNYIVFDLEWNQGNSRIEREVATLPFEIIEMGAVKLSPSGEDMGEFSQLIRPQVYKEMHRITGELIHLRMKELKNGKAFFQVAEEFLRWCGEDYIFCTWGSADLTELQRNLEFYDMHVFADGPISFYDVQKLFSLAFEDGKSRKSLEYAVDFLGIEKNRPFHRALEDAFYTGQVFRRIIEEHAEVLAKISYDTYHPPINRKAEIKIQFDTYMKYISREFADKEEMFADREVISSKCYLCHRNLRKKIKWFTPNGKNYYCLAYCHKHGYLKGKIRVRKGPGGGCFAVKTTKLTDEKEAQALEQRKQHVKDMRKKHQ